MPWRCAQCSTEIADDAVGACPGCGDAKTAWTLVKDQTRRLVVGGKRFVCERGASDAAPAAPLAAAYDAAEWVTTEVAPALPTAEARRLAAAGLGPAPRDVLRVVQHPGKGAPSAVRLTTLPEARVTVTSEHPARPDEPHDARFLLVFGEEPAGLSFDGLQVIDVTDDAGPGHAPQLEVVALKKPHQTLPIEPRAVIDWSLFSLDLSPHIDWSLFSLDVAAREPEPEAAADGEPDWSLFSLEVTHASGEPGEG